MSRSRFAVVALCGVLGASGVLGACGEKFVANGAAGGNAGTSSAGAGNASSEAGAAGSPGPDNSAGEAGSEAGGAGAPSSGGTGGSAGNAGGSASGAGGAQIELPQAGLLVWLRADRGIQQADGHVQGWLDQSGNQTDAMQTTVNARPKFLAEGFDGRPTLEFDGQGQFLTFAKGFGDFSKGLAGLTVSKPLKSDCAAILEFSNGREIDDVFLGVGLSKWQYEVEALWFQVGQVDLERFSLFSVNHRPAGNADLRLDGSLLSTVDVTVPIIPESGERVNNFVGHTLYDGCGFFQGQISEIILYSRPLTNSERDTIEDYLKAHWALGEQ